MAHPYQRHREHHKERERVSSLYSEVEPHRDYQHVYHRAKGGKVEHHDAAEDKAVVKSMVKSDALKKSPHRADKRARGGKVNKHKGKTVVNVNVAPQQSAPPHPPMPMPAPGAAPAAPPTRPPMPSQAPPGAMPPMGPHASGGRTYATGGKVEPDFKMGSGMGPKPVGIGKGEYLVGKKMKDFSEKGGMSPMGDSGVGGGVARKQMNNRAAKYYHKTPPAVHTPGMKAT